MSNIASDGFGGTSGDALSTYDANWVASSGTTADGTISDAGRVRGASTSTIARYRDDVTPASADYSVSCDLYIASTMSNRAGVTARQSASANTRYLARYNRLTAGVELSKTVAGTTTQLGSTSSQTASAGNTYRLELVCNGSTIEAYWDGGGTPVISQTDSAISNAGHPGIYFVNPSSAGNTSGIHIDNWSVDTLSADVTIGLTGTAVTASTGSLGGEFACVLSGVAGSFTQGNLIATTAVSVIGHSAAFAAGTVVPSVAIALIGIQATFSPGTLTASSSGGDTAALVGEVVTFAQTAPSVSVTVALTGIAATMAAGILSASSGTATITVKAGSWLRYKKLQ